MTTVPVPRPSVDRLALARQVLENEAHALRDVAARLDDSFSRAVELLLGCSGRVAISGTGKSADVAAKICGTFNSTGTRAYFLDATRAVHGDLGMVHPGDVALILSHSGESEEIVRFVGPLKGLCARVVALTGNPKSALARLADLTLCYGPVTETCPLKLAPSTSTTVMMALGDALAFVMSETRQFDEIEFARFHPAGSLGRKLAPVESWMRRGDELRMSPDTLTVREVFSRDRKAGRRTGAVMLVDADGRLSGLFTDSDLAKLFERHADGWLDRPIAEVMTRSPVTILPSARLAEAVELLQSRRISELPVVNEGGVPVGLVDITDVVGQDGNSRAGYPRLFEGTRPQ